MTLPSLASPPSCTKEEPATLVAGDTWTWAKSITDYPASDGWTLKYRLVGAAAEASYSAVADGDDYAISIAAATTATYPVGSVGWFAFVERGAGAELERVTVDEGRFTVRPNPATLTAAQSLTHARKVLAAIEAVIEGRASKDQEEYSIGNRSLKRTPVADLLLLKRKYQSEVLREEQAVELARGFAPSSAIKARFR